MFRTNRSNTTFLPARTQPARTRTVVSLTVAALVALLLLPAAASAVRPNPERASVLFEGLGRLSVAIEHADRDGRITRGEKRALIRKQQHLIARIAGALRDGSLRPRDFRRFRTQLRRLERQVAAPPVAHQPVVTFKKKPGVAQYGGASWDNVVGRVQNTTAEQCQAICAEESECDFMFYNSRGNLIIGHHHKPADPSINSRYRECVMFSGKPWWGSAGQSDGYIKLVDGVPAR